MPISREAIEIPTGQSFRLIRWSRSVGAVESLLADGNVVPLPGKGGRWHSHPEMELTLFTEGRGNRFVGDHIGGFDAGDLVLLGSMLPHHWHAEGPTAGLSLQWHFPAHHPLWELPETRRLNGLFQRAARGLCCEEALRHGIAERMAALTHTSGLIRLGHLLELLAVLAEAPTDQTLPLASRSFIPPSDGTYQESLGRVLRHLVVHFREPVRLEDLLKLARMSRPTFARQFKRHTGRSSGEFLLELRLQAACRELLDTSRCVLEIALATGFSQVSFFNRVFRRAMGCSPSAYRVGTPDRPAPLADV